MNSDLKEIKRELSLGLNQFDPKAKYSIIITNPAQVKHNLNFINHSLFRDIFTPLNNDTQIFNSQARTDWKKDIVGHHFQEKLIQEHQQQIRIVIMIPTIEINNMVTSVQKIFAQFDADEEYSIILYDTPICDQMNEDIIQWMDEIIEQNSDNKVCSFLDRLQRSWRIMHMKSSEIQIIDPSKLVDFLGLQVYKPFSLQKLEGYFAKQQISEDELRKCQISFQKQFDQQLDQVIGILFENFEKIEAQTIVEQEIVQKLVQFEEKFNNFQLGVQPIQEFSQIFMEAIQLLSSEQLPLDESILDDLNINMEIMDFYNRNQLGLKFEISLKLRVGLRLVDDLLKARKRKGYGSCTIM